MRNPWAPQRGISLLFALVTLAAMSLAAVALLRSVNTSSLVVANLGFKQSSVAYAGAAAEDAIVGWLDPNKAGTVLNSVQAAHGYYPIAYDNLDPTYNTQSTGVVTRAVVDWDGDSCSAYAAGSFATCLTPSPPVVLPFLSSQYTTQYLITRLCNLALPATDATNSCARAVASSTVQDPSRQGLSYLNPRPSTLVQSGPYYRIVVRTMGARNAVSYTETIVHF